MKEIRESERECKKAPLLIHKCVLEGQTSRKRPLCPSGTHLSFFYLLVDMAPLEDKKSHCIARRGRGDVEDIPSSIPEILRGQLFC